VGVNSVGSPVEIAHSRLHDHVTAIDIFGVGDPTPPEALVRDSRIEDCQNHGIFVVENSNTTIERCEITRCALSGSPRGAIQLSNQSVSGANDPTIADCHVHDNVWQGMTAFDITGQGHIAPLVTGNVFERNLTGVYLLYASGRLVDNEIRDNFEAGNPNSGAGVMVAGATARPTLVGNTLTGNFTAFYVIDGAQPDLGNVGDADPDNDGGNVMFDNVDMSGSTWSVYSLSSADISAENNTWDSTDPVEIAVTIFDGNDDPSVGFVDFDPIYTTVSVGDVAVAPVAPLAAPNPFRVQTTFAASSGAIEIFDASGRRVCVLAGNGAKVWDGRDDAGRALPADVYFARTPDGPPMRIVRLP